MWRFKRSSGSSFWPKTVVFSRQETDIVDRHLFGLLVRNGICWNVLSYDSKVQRIFTEEKCLDISLTEFLTGHILGPMSTI
jgi:hypothetical protein